MLLSTQAGFRLISLRGLFAHKRCCWGLLVPDDYMQFEAGDVKRYLLLREARLLRCLGFRWIGLGLLEIDCSY